MPGTTHFTRWAIGASFVIILTSLRVGDRVCSKHAMWLVHRVSIAPAVCTCAIKTSASDVTGNFSINDSFVSDLVPAFNDLDGFHDTQENDRGKLNFF